MLPACCEQGAGAGRQACPVVRCRHIVGLCRTGTKPTTPNAGGCGCASGRRHQRAQAPAIIPQAANALHCTAMGSSLAQAPAPGRTGRHVAAPWPAPPGNISATNTKQTSGEEREQQPLGSPQGRGHCSTGTKAAAAAAAQAARQKRQQQRQRSALATAGCPPPPGCAARRTPACTARSTSAGCGNTGEWVAEGPVITSHSQAARGQCDPMPQPPRAINETHTIVQAVCAWRWCGWPTQQRRVCPPQQAGAQLAQQRR